MNANFQKGLLRAAKSCVAEAANADRRGDRRYAKELRSSARAALSELDAGVPTPVAPVVPISPWLAKRREQGRAYAMALSQLMGQPPRPPRS